MASFQVGDEVRVIGLPTSEFYGIVGVVAKTVERDGLDGDVETGQECAVQFPGIRRWFLSRHLEKAVPDKALRFFRREVLERWKDLSPAEVVGLNGTRSDLISFLKDHFGLRQDRAVRETDLFLAELTERIRVAKDTPPRRTQASTGTLRSFKVSA